MNDDAGPQSHTVPLLWILVIVAIPVAIFYRTKRPPPAPPPPPAMLVPLGTNSPMVGATFYDPASRAVGGTVLQVDNAYEFADGTVRPGLLLKARNGAEAWVPLENMRKVLVEAR